MFVRHLSGLQRPEPDQPLGYTTFLEDFQKLLVSLGHDGSKFGTHSGKRGGATAASEAGMSMTDLQRLGGWRSSSLPQKYVYASAAKQLHLSSMLHGPKKL